MVHSQRIISFFCFLAVSSAACIPASNSTDGLDSRDTAATLNAGSGFKIGKVGDMTWAASGILTKGCPSSSISNCYGMYLSNNASAMLDTEHLDSPRQRNEWHFPSVASGQSFSYSWKQYLDTATGSSTHFFHLMQVFGASEGNPIVALDALKGKLQIVDYTNPACGSSCPQAALSNYLGKYATHSISGKFGPSGGLTYTVAGPNGKIVSYSKTGGLGKAGGYIKFGTYRLTFSPMTTVNTMVGDWQTYV
ncbi:hypothetical protein C8R43DRAFT_1205961 [Mycena crocata]|nr:hypothetical protein C8R43DRAFT_1205961 [Mycena crocata]